MNLKEETEKINSDIVRAQNVRVLRYCDSWRPTRRRVSNRTVRGYLELSFPLRLEHTGVHSQQKDRLAERAHH